MFVRVTGVFPLIGALAIGVAACASKATSPDAYELVVAAPGLESVRPKVTTKKYDYQVVEHSVWRRDDAEWPKADMIFWRITENFRGHQIYVYESSMPDLIRAYLPGEWITVRGGGKAGNVLGGLDYQRFRLKSDIECIFVRQGIDRFSELVEVVGTGEPLGDMVIRGWYCAGPTSGSQDAEFQAFIRGIGVRGWALP